MNDKPRVGIVMGSASDLSKAKEASDVLAVLEVPWEVVVASAHRTPAKVADYATQAAARGLEVIIAGAGLAAHLPGVIAAHTALPVIALPLAGGTLGGLDALLSTVQMPPGIPVATVGIDAGQNAALLAAAILAVGDEELSRRLVSYRRRMAEQQEAKADKRIEEIWGGSQ